MATGRKPNDTSERGLNVIMHAYTPCHRLPLHRRGQAPSVLPTRGEAFQRRVGHFCRILAFMAGNENDGRIEGSRRAGGQAGRQALR